MSSLKEQIQLALEEAKKNVLKKEETERNRLNALDEEARKEREIKYSKMEKSSARICCFFTRFN